MRLERVKVPWTEPRFKSNHKALISGVWDFVELHNFEREPEITYQLYLPPPINITVMVTHSSPILVAARTKENKKTAKKYIKTTGD